MVSAGSILLLKDLRMSEGYLRQKKEELGKHYIYFYGHDGLHYTHHYNQKFYVISVFILLTCIVLALLFCPSRAVA